MTICMTALETEAESISPSQKGSSSGSTYFVCVIVGQSYALPSKSIDVRCGALQMADGSETHVIITPVINEEEDDVWLTLRKVNLFDR